MSELYETLENTDTEYDAKEEETNKDVGEDSQSETAGVGNANETADESESTEDDKIIKSEDKSTDTVGNEDLDSVKEEIQAHIDQLMKNDKMVGTDQLQREKKRSITVPKSISSQSEYTSYQEVITVKFITDSSETFASAYNMSCKVKEVKQKIATALNTDSNTIKLEKDGYTVDDWLPLSGLGVEPLGSLELKLTSSDPRVRITSAAISDYIPTVDVITVHVSTGRNLYKDVIVEIENQCLHKEWLGGYRNKKTNVEYHHGSTQTLPKKYQVYIQSENGEVIPRLFERETQTALPLRNVGTETPCVKATQMYTSDQYVPLPGDRVITAKRFETYEEWCQKNDVEKKVTIIQRAFRQWSKLAKDKEMARYYEDQRNVLQGIKDDKINTLTEQVKKKRKTMDGSAFPSSRDDFYMLYLMVGKWWKKEWQRIQDLRSEEARKAEYIALLEKEITLLSAIEKHRIEAKEESSRKEKMRFLDVTAQATVFRCANGALTTIDDPDTQKAREFKEMYTRLTRTDQTIQERIEFLLTLKNLMLQHDGYEFSNNLITLIEREIDLLAIGFKDKELVGLRKRIEQFFMDFIRHPQFNPKAIAYRKQAWSKQSAANLYKCKRCLKMLPPSRFPVHSRMPSISVCKSCDWLQNIGNERTDMSPYLKMLKHVQNEEMQKSSYSSICFVLQQTGMYFLSNVIWHGHSAISEQREVSKLRMVRWLNDVEWSPWNTILLTDEEAKCHAKIKNVNEFYEKAFINSVHQKHILARIHFLPLLKTDHNLRSTSDWQKIQESFSVKPGQILHTDVQGEDETRDYSLKDLLGQKKNKAIEALLSDL